MSNYEKNHQDVIRFAKELQLARVADYQDQFSHPGGILIRPPGEHELKLFHDILNTIFVAGKHLGENETEEVLKSDLKLLMYDNDKLKTIIKNLEEDCQVHRSAVAVLQGENVFYKKRNDILLTKLKMKAKGKRK